MAVGYSDNSDYNYSLDVTSDAALTGTYSDITATLKANAAAEEVFAGDLEPLTQYLIVLPVAPAAVNELLKLLKVNISFLSLTTRRRVLAVLPSTLAGMFWK